MRIENEMIKCPCSDTELGEFILSLRLDNILDVFRKDWLHCPLGLLTGGKQAEICHNFGIFRVPCNIPTTFGNIEESF
jgi:hypothetical protein